MKDARNRKQIRRPRRAISARVAATCHRTHTHRPIGIESRAPLCPHFPIFPRAARRITPTFHPGIASESRNLGQSEKCQANFSARCASPAAFKLRTSIRITRTAHLRNFFPPLPPLRFSLLSSCRTSATTRKSESKVRGKTSLKTKKKSSRAAGRAESRTRGPSLRCQRAVPGVRSALD